MSRELSPVRQSQAEKLHEIGEDLRQVRELSGHSIEEMAQRTVIQARILRAIESGGRNQLPEAIYVQGFIRRYADALGLEGGAIAEQFPDEEPIQLPVKQTRWQESPAAQLRPFHLYAAYVALIMLSVSWLSSVVGRTAVSQLASPVGLPVSPGEMARNPAPSGLARSAMPPQLPQQLQQKLQQLPVPAQPNTATPDRNNSVLSASQPVRVDIKLIDQSWLHVESDGKTEFEGVLSEGTKQTWTAKSVVRVRAGNAGAVIVAQNGGKQKPLGEPGAVKEVTFSADRNSASLPEAIGTGMIH